MTDAIARKHAHDVAELISCYAAPLVRRAAQAPHGRGRRSRLRRAADACRFFDGTRASRFDDPRAEVCLRDAREALEALCEALRATEPWDALGRRVLRAAAQDLDALENKAWRTIAVNALDGREGSRAAAPVPVEDDLDELVVECGRAAAAAETRTGKPSPKPRTRAMLHTNGRTRHNT